MRKVTATMAAFILTGVLAACAGNESGQSLEDCTPTHDFSTVREGTLTVAAYEFPPYSSVDQRTGDLGGIDGDIVNEIAKLECLTVTPKVMAVSAIIQSVESGRVDIAVGDWYRTEARVEVINMTDPLYTDQMAIVSEDGETTLAKLKGKNVGALDGSIWTGDLKKYFGADLKVYPSPLNMFQDLQNGRLDAAIESYGASRFNVKGLKVEVAEPERVVAASMESAQTTFPLSKENDKLLKAFNEDIADLRENGVLGKIVSKHGLDESAAEPGEPRFLGK